MRRPSAVAVAVIAVGLVGATITTLVVKSTLAFTIGVPPAGPAVTARSGETVCQRPIVVPEGGGFDRVRFTLGTFRRPGPAIDVAIRTGRRTVARGRLPAGYADVDRVPSHVVRFAEVAPGQRVAVCLRNAGRSRVAIFGGGDAAARSTTAVADGRPVPADLSLVFEREPRSFASLLPDMFKRASLWRAPVVGSWTFVALLALLVFAAPALLVVSLRGAGGHRD